MRAPATNSRGHSAHRSCSMVRRRRRHMMALDAVDLERLPDPLRAPGLRSASRRCGRPVEAQADVIVVPNDCIVVVAQAQRLRPGRPTLGAKLGARDPRVTMRFAGGMAGEVPPASVLHVL